MRHIRLLTHRTVEQFLLRLFLRDEPIRSLCIASPFISRLTGSRFTLEDLSKKVATEAIPTFVVTRQPIEPYQQEAIFVLEQNPWVEIRFNESLHAKVLVAAAQRGCESFALFGSGNVTGRSIESNIEVGMMILSHGGGRAIVDELYYWVNQRLRILTGSKLHQAIRLT